MIPKYKPEYNIPNIWVKKIFNDHGDVKNMFKWYECGILGCGQQSVPWLDLEKFIKWPDNVKAITSEITNQLTIAGYRPGGGTCLLPIELNNYKFLTHYQFFCEKYIPLSVRNSIRSPQALDEWVCRNLGNPVWQSVLTVKKQPNAIMYWTGKHDAGAVWQNSDLPLLKNWITDMENYLFKHIGRVVVYQNKINHPVPIHRDYPISKYGNSAHFVNIQLTTNNRLAFVYDEITKEKIYTLSRAYMFNESDCHGVDAEEESHFTIRIDGEFQQHVCEELGLINGKVFSLDYNNSFKFKNLKIIDLADS
jgi:hypothetical protein